jgi:hypothetical protein
MTRALAVTIAVAAATIAAFETSKLQGAVLPNPQPADNYRTTIRVWRDCSGSPSEVELAHAVPGIIAALEQLDWVTQIELLRFSCGGERLAMARPEVFSLSGQTERTAHSPLGKLFKAQTEAASVASLAARHEVLSGPFRDAVLRAPTNGAPCTRFDAVCERMVGERRPFELVLTDGWVDCAQTAPRDARGRGATVVIVVPRKEDPAGDDPATLHERLDAMRKAFPGATVVPPYGLSQALQSTQAAK